MIYQIKSYLKFLYRSTNQHGVHSPFVFNLVTECFYNKENFPEYSKLKKYRKELLSNHTRIKITDLGAGSRTTKNSTRAISNIAKHSGTTFKRSKLLYRLANYFKPNSILEFGTSLGIATQAMALGNSTAKIITIEGCPTISAFSKQQFTSLDLKNIDQLTGNFNEFIPELSKNTFDLVFFDGNHQKEATLNYFETMLPSVNNDTVFIFDDIYWSKGMTEAWETIKNHPKVTVTIDTFFWGLVFFRKEQQKEHFTIRF